MKSILITGCNRGLGLGLVKALAKNSKSPTKCIIATCRNLEKAQDLTKVAEKCTNVFLLELDVLNTNSFESFSKNVEGIVKENGLNVLFNNAGFSPKSTKINFTKPEEMLKTFKTNTVGPLMLTKELLPMLKKASKLNKNLPVSTNRAAVLFMSSGLGSIALNKEGGIYAYRCSKAALNMVTKSLSIDLHQHDILVTSIHPGWVQTDMGSSRAPLKIQESVEQIIELMKNLNHSHNGGFYQYDGKELDW